VGVDDANGVTNYWVTVKGNDVFDTGWQNYTESDSGTKTVNSSYAGLAVGKHYLLVQIPGQIDEKTLPQVYTGALKDIPQDVNDQVIADIRQQAPKVAAQFLPVMLDTQDFRRDFIFPVGIFFATGIVIALVLIYMGVRRSISPYRHPI